MIPEEIPSLAGSEAGKPQDEVATEQELYAALRAAGASPEEAQSCIAAGQQSPAA